MPIAGPGAIAPADTLATRTYLGLLAAQFLAAFNDQAIHAAAMFFAINTQTLSEANAIALMPILFYAPWALFCTLAGYFADRYSKRTSLVTWKVAEVGITGLALFGFWLGTGGGEPHAGAWVVLSTVFLMGTHSAFFVPAKYGVMPEILQPHLLSRGNGVLESLSFLAVILGTVSGGVLSFVFLRREANIGIILLCLAVVGVLASLFIRRMPAANPTLRFPRYLYGPLVANLKTLLWSRTLAFAVIGIAFFTFIVAFMRATVYMFGQSQNPKWDELKTSAVVGTVALGVGLGSPLAGWLSGRKVELGLIPIGAAGMILGCVLAGLTLGYIPGLVACTVLIGVCTGFYLVPLFTLLQYRAHEGEQGGYDRVEQFHQRDRRDPRFSSFFAGCRWLQEGRLPAADRDRGPCRARRASPDRAPARTTGLFPGRQPRDRQDADRRETTPQHLQPPFRFSAASPTTQHRDRSLCQGARRRHREPLPTWRRRPLRHPARRSAREPGIR